VEVGAKRSEGELADFGKMKRIFERLPRDSLVRKLAMVEPDTMPKEEARKKSLVLLEMLQAEAEHVMRR
jgi:hypothetical protein